MYVLSLHMLALSSSHGSRHCSPRAGRHVRPTVRHVLVAFARLDCHAIALPISVRCAPVGVSNSPSAVSMSFPHVFASMFVLPPPTQHSLRRSTCPVLRAMFVGLLHPCPAHIWRPPSTSHLAPVIMPRSILPPKLFIYVLHTVVLTNLLSTRLVCPGRHVQSVARHTLALAFVSVCFCARTQHAPRHWACPVCAPKCLYTDPEAYVRSFPRSVFTPRHQHVQCAAQSAHIALALFGAHVLIYPNMFHFAPVRIPSSRFQEGFLPRLFACRFAARDLPIQLALLGADVCVFPGLLRPTPVGLSSLPPEMRIRLTFPHWHSRTSRVPSTYLRAMWRR